VLRKTTSQANAQAAAAQQAPQQQQANAQAENTASSDLATLQGADNFATDLGKLAWITLASRRADSHRAPPGARRRAAELQSHWVTERIRENARRPADLRERRLDAGRNKGGPDLGILSAQGPVG